jgi:hypothetical protein
MSYLRSSTKGLGKIIYNGSGKSHKKEVTTTRTLEPTGLKKNTSVTVGKIVYTCEFTQFKEAT